MVYYSKVVFHNDFYKHLYFPMYWITINILLVILLVDYIIILDTNISIYYRL